MRRAGALALALIVAACSYPTKWKDLSGQARTQEQAKADLEGCRGKAGWSDKTVRDLSVDQEQALWQSIQACMTEHGWKLVRADDDD